MMEFFKHENQPYPAALSDGGSLYTGTKSDLVNPVLKGVKLPTDEFKTESLIIDGSAFIHVNKPTKVETFDAYARYIMIQLEKEIIKRYAKVTHVVFDIYMDSSLKAHARNIHGKGVRRKVTATTYTPRNWELF